MKYITVEEASIKWNIAIRQVQRLCASGKIKATKISNKVWLIERDQHNPKGK